MSQVERICSEAISERDELLEALQAAEIRHEDESAQMQAAIVDLRRQAAHWEEQAKEWQNHYSRVEQDLLAFSRSVSMESPSKHYSAPISAAKHGSDQSCPSVTPTRSKTDSPVTPRSPKRPSTGRTGLHSDVSTPGKQSGSARACAATHGPPRQIFIRRIQAVVHVKEENDGQDSVGDQDSSDELMMNGPQEIYGGVGPASPSPKSPIKRTAFSGEAKASPAKRRRISYAASVDQ
ncbi:hypothetical protein B0H10DRAFT_2152679 [Mycena sp. CBHHK59/15]|nr:hypothetical protein B0H10DRAFT_2152679 [Mycena sp. CBHHK59/15]